MSLFKGAGEAVSASEEPPCVPRLAGGAGVLHGLTQLGPQLQRKATSPPSLMRSLPVRSLVFWGPLAMKQWQKEIKAWLWGPAAPAESGCLSLTRHS